MIGLDLAHKKSSCMPWTKKVRLLSPVSMGWETILFPQAVTAGHIAIGKDIQSSYREGE